MTQLACDETRLIVDDHRDDVPDGNVAMITDGEAGGVEVVADGLDPPAGDGRANRATVQHSGKNKIVRVLHAAGGLSDSVFARDVRADSVHGGNLDASSWPSKRGTDRLGGPPLREMRHRTRAP